MSEMVERVARAIQDKACIYECTPGDPIEAWAMESARAAIEAMREPTDAMAAAATFAVQSHSSARDADKAIYRAMLKEALK